ncbi:hypothetical protein R3B00_001313 [Klebsiella pneumoniae]|nr:hypothetical protein [Klebsiella pneumoniae]ELQ8980651.1 hypothetical protein [Klebsiella pneumoniae]
MLKEQTFTKTYDHVMKDNSVSLLARNVYCRLARFTENGREAFPDQEWLAEEFGETGDKGAQKIYRAIKELKYYGVITAHQRGKKQSNVYTVNEWPIECSIKIDESRKIRYAGYKSESSNMMSHNESESSNMMIGESSNMMNIRDNINIQSTTNRQSLKEDEELKESVGIIENEIVNDTSVSTVSISSSPCTSNSPNLTVVESEQDDPPTPTESQSTITNTPQHSSSHDYKNYRMPTEIAEKLNRTIAKNIAEVGANNKYYSTPTKVDYGDFEGF